MIFSNNMNFINILDRPIAYHRSFVPIVGVIGSVMLSQAVYWSTRTSNKEGWFYKTEKEWEDETGLSRWEQETARKRMIKSKIIEIKRKGIPAKLYFKINIKKLEELLKLTQVCDNTTDKYAIKPQLDCDNTANKSKDLSQSNTYTTTENTTKITSDIVSATAEDKKESFISDKKNISNSSETKISQNSNLKNNLVENVRPASAVSKSTVFSFSEELSKMEANKRRDIQIVALYWKFKGFSVENKEQYQSALTRELRAAKNLKGYSDDQILATMRYLNKTATNYVWVLETINKRINEPIVYQPSDENLSEREYHTKYLSYDEETGQTYTYGNATEDEISPEELKIYKERIARHEAYLKENKGKPPKPINFKEIESDFKKPIDKITKKEDIYLITCQE